MISQTLIIIIITCAVSIPAFSNRKILNDLIMYPPSINRGQYYRLLTSGFIHGNYQHLFFNMLTLYFFGSSIEKVMQLIAGKYSFLIMYLTAIVISSLPSYFKHRQDSYYSALGASGGVSAIVFASIIFAPWAWFQFPPVPAIVYGIGYLVYSAYMSKKGGDNIGHDAHFWGALFGVAFIFVAEPKMVQYFLEQIMHPQGP